MRGIQLRDILTFVAVGFVVGAAARDFGDRSEARAEAAQIQGERRQLLIDAQCVGYMVQTRMATHQSAAILGHDVRTCFNVLRGQLVK